MLGAIHQPILRQLCIGDGSETTLNGKPVRVRSGRSLDQATLLYTERRLIVESHGVEGLEALEARCNIVRTWGDCYGYLLLSCGFADIMMDSIMKPWDLLPLVPIVQGAGGMITDWRGGDVLKSDSSVAALPELHAQVIRILNS